MNTDYTVGDLIYDANIYDGMNTDLSDLQFYKRQYFQLLLKRRFFLLTFFILTSPCRINAHVFHNL